MNATLLFEWIDRHRSAIRASTIAILAVLVAGVYAVVYMTGGIKFVYSHSMYIPILLSAFVFGTKGGVSVGLLAGIALGPFMPIDVATGEQQDTINWLYRTGAFTLIGLVSGAASDSVRSYIAHLRWISRHDGSTQLPNRSALQDGLSEFARQESTGPLLLVAISLENGMELKSALGFTVIEEAIRQLARRFETQLAGARIYRTETAQLGLLLNTCAEEIDKCLDDLAVASRAPIRFNEIPVHVDTRIGYVAFDQVEETPDVYLQRAETALATAYETGHDCVAYSPAIKTATGKTLSILGELKDALERGQLSLDYQPKIAIPTKDVYGVEALMRWNHPERGNIPPDEFIPRAEHSTLIHLITEFALEQAMGQVVRWQQDGINLPIAVNISARNLLQPGLTDLILRLLDRHGLSGDSLELEVTEGALMIDMDRSVEVLAQLDEARIIISIDDFGTGYSSLQYLHQLPISLVKIDQSFARRLPYDKGAAHVLEAAVTLAHKMGIRTVAEGVESKEVYDFLENVGCDMAQGFMISPPLPAADFARWYMQCNGIYRHAHE